MHTAWLVAILLNCFPHTIFLFEKIINYYLRLCLASEGVMSLGVRLSCLSRCVSVCVCRITLGGEGNALYPVLSTVFLLYAFVLVVFTLKA